MAIIPIVLCGVHWYKYTPGVSNVNVDVDTKAVSLNISDGVEMTDVESLLDEQGYTVVQG